MPSLEDFYLHMEEFEYPYFPRTEDISHVAAKWFHNNQWFLNAIWNKMWEEEEKITDSVDIAYVSIRIVYKANSTDTDVHHCVVRVMDIRCEPKRELGVYGDTPQLPHRMFEIYVAPTVDSNENSVWLHYKKDEFLKDPLVPYPDQPLGIGGRVYEHLCMILSCEDN